MAANFNFAIGILATPKTSETKSDRKDQSRYVCHKAQTPDSKCKARWWRGDDLNLFCSHRTLAHCSHWVDHEVIYTLKYLSCKTDCPAYKTWSKYGYATRKWCCNNSKSTPEWLKQIPAMVQSNPDLTLIDVMIWS